MTTMTDTNSKAASKSSASKSGLILIAAALVFMATNADAPSFNLSIATL